jgi:hypothetical protein
MKKLLIVARYKENIDWLDKLPAGWEWLVVDKGRGDLPNVWGREAHSYLHAVTSIYDAIKDDDLFAFAQGRPFDHCPDYMADIDTKWIQGQVHSCNSQGLPHADYLDLNGFCHTFGLPVQRNYSFSGGTHFKVTGAQIKAHPVEFYRSLYELSKIDGAKDIRGYTQGWKTLCALERLWGVIFKVPGLHENT